MKMKISKALTAALVAAVLAATAGAQSKFTLKAHTGRGQIG